MSVQQQVNQGGHVSDVDDSVAINVSTDSAQAAIGAQQMVDERGHVGDVDIAVMVHVTNRVAGRAVLQSDAPAPAPRAAGAVDIQGLDTVIEHACRRQVADGIGLAGDAGDQAVVLVTVFRHSPQLRLLQLSGIYLNALELRETALAGDGHLVQLITIEHGHALGKRGVAGDGEILAIGAGRDPNNL